jgi:hypothetical protein
LDTLFAPVIPENLLLYQGETGLMNYSKFHSRDYILPEESENPSSPENTPSPDSPDNRTRIKKKNLINKLNYVHFNDGTILVKLKHKKYDSELTLEAKPQPCIKDVLECRWVPIQGLDQKLSSYAFSHVLLSDGLQLIQLEAKVLTVDSKAITLELPEFCYELSYRKVKRHTCTDIEVEFLQNGAVFYGTLLDFTPLAFRVRIDAIPPQTFQWINPKLNVNLILKQNQQVVYSGATKIVRQESGIKNRLFVLQPTENQIQRFMARTFRSPRYSLIPSPTVSFMHPLTHKVIYLSVNNVSGSGISVEEHFDQSLLIPGMIIDGLMIEIGNKPNIKTKAQVIYRKELSNEKGIVAKVQSGLSFLDMTMQDQINISSILHNVNNEKSYVCNRLDLEALWKFFFDTGFIYPQKYLALNTYKEKFKETYGKLYRKDQNIVRYFIHQDKGVISGHFSMIRFYEKSWIIQHHAGNSSNRFAGLEVLKQVGQYSNDFRCLYSTHMDFLMGYFTANNRFPEKIWGQFARELGDPKKSSLDTFAYFHMSKNFKQEAINHPYLISKTTQDDLLELASFYEHISGGLTLDAIDMTPNDLPQNGIHTIDDEYKKYGLVRKRHMLSIKKHGSLKAVLSIVISDYGLNLSNLTNCIHVFILDQEDTAVPVLYSTLYRLLKLFESDKIPILIFPYEYAENNKLYYEKLYRLWTINTQFGDEYLSYVKKLLIRD